MSGPLAPEWEDPLLELEVWDAPDRLSDREGFDAIGADWRRAETLIDDPETGR